MNIRKDEDLHKIERSRELDRRVAGLGSRTMLSRFSLGRPLQALAPLLGNLSEFPEKLAFWLRQSRNRRLKVVHQPAMFSQRLAIFPLRKRLFRAGSDGGTSRHIIVRSSSFR